MNVDSGARVDRVHTGGRTMTPFPGALGLGPEQVEMAIRAAGMAPSLYNNQPWGFRIAPNTIELHADLGRRLPVVDPNDRELRLGCGAALFNLRLALEHVDVRPSVTPMPRSDDPTLLAVVRSGGTSKPDTERDRLFRAIPTRRTNRRPFLPTPVPETHRNALIGSVETERCWLDVVERDQRSRVIRLLHRAHELQRADESYREEMARRTGLREGAREGVPAAAAGPRREAQDEWVLRDFSGGKARPRTPGKDFEDDPLTLVLSSDRLSRAADLRAGQAMQRLLLTATVLGLSVSLMSQVVEVPETREELRGSLGGTAEPQAVLRVGYGSPVPATPRRPPTDLLINDEWTDLELGPQQPSAP